MKRRSGTGCITASIQATSSSSKTAITSTSSTGSREHTNKVSGYGARAVRKSPGNILDSLGATFEFADGMVFSYSASQFTAGGYTDIGENFLCEKGTVRTTRRGYEVYNKSQRGAPPEIVQSETSKADITFDANECIRGRRAVRVSWRMLRLMR